MDHATNRIPLQVTDASAPNNFVGAEIHLVVRPMVHEAELTHEILHWALDEVAGDPDSLHREGVAWQ